MERPPASSGLGRRVPGHGGTDTKKPESWDITHYQPLPQLLVLSRVFIVYPLIKCPFNSSSLSLLFHFYVVVLPAGSPTDVVYAFHYLRPSLVPKVLSNKPHHLFCFDALVSL